MIGFPTRNHSATLVMDLFCTHLKLSEQQVQSPIDDLLSVTTSRFSEYLEPKELRILNAASDLKCYLYLDNWGHLSFGVMTDGMNYTSS